MGKSQFLGKGFELRHASGWNGDGRTLCGLVEEGDAAIGESAPIIAVAGHITCPDCRGIISHVVANVTSTFTVRRAGTLRGQ